MKVSKIVCVAINNRLEVEQRKLGRTCEIKIPKAVYVAIAASVLLAGCQPALMNIDVPAVEECPECECELPPVPPPIPKKIKIDIDREKIIVNTGGRLLLDQYIRSRQIIYDLWQK